MSDTDPSTDSPSGRAAQSAGGRPDVPPGASGEDTGALTSALRAGIVLVLALRQLLRAWRKLAVAEAQVLRVAIPLLVLSTAALAMFSMALWGCLLALIGWALMLATRSLGLALGLLAIINAVFAAGVGLMVLHAARQVTLPHARRELKLLGHSLAQDLNHLTRAAPDHAERADASSNDEDGK